MRKIASACTLAALFAGAPAVSAQTTAAELAEWFVGLIAVTGLERRMADAIAEEW